MWALVNAHRAEILGVDRYKRFPTDEGAEESLDAGRQRREIGWRPQKVSIQVTAVPALWPGHVRSPGDSGQAEDVGIRASLATTLSAA
jgi:hypothetical protein